MSSPRWTCADHRRGARTHRKALCHHERRPRPQPRLRLRGAACRPPKPSSLIAGGPGVLSGCARPDARSLSAARQYNPPSRIGGVLGIAADIWPKAKPLLRDLMAFLAEQVHEVTAAVELRRVPQFRGRLAPHLDGAHLHGLVVLGKVSAVIRNPIVHGHNEI